MEKLARLQPEHLAYIVGAAVLVLLSQVLWDWRHPIVTVFKQWRVNNSSRGYVTSDGHATVPATATNPIAATNNDSLPLIAMGRNDDNEPLTRNDSNRVLQARAELIARLLKSESLYIRDSQGNYRRVTQTGLIELATGLRPNGRPESDYGQLRAELEPLIKPQIVISAGRPEERSIAKYAEEVRP